MFRKVIAIAIASVGLAACAAAIETGAPSAAVGDPEPTKSFNGLALETQIAQTGFSGVAAIGRDGQLTFVSTHGLANRDTGEAIEPDTRFSLASLPKMITAIGIMQLVEAGDVNLDDPVGKHLPDYPNAEIREQATVRHLIKMQSGLGDYFGPEYERAVEQGTLRTHADYIPLFADQPLAFSPGEGFEYSNAGYILLGRIIETHSNQDYFSYVSERILEPAGMRDTDLAASRAIGPGTAISYKVDGLDRIASGPEDLVGRNLVPSLPKYRGLGTSAGGGYSTVADFMRLGHALREETLISWRSLGEIFGERFVNGEAAGGLAGGAPGVSALFRMLPDGRTIVVLANTDLPGAIEIGRMMEAEIKRQAKSAGQGRTGAFLKCSPVSGRD